MKHRVIAVVAINVAAIGNVLARGVLVTEDFKRQLRLAMEADATFTYQTAGYLELRKLIKSRSEAYRRKHGDWHSHGAKKPP